MLIGHPRIANLVGKVELVPPRRTAEEICCHHNFAGYAPVCHIRQLLLILYCYSEVGWACTLDTVP